MMALSPLSSPLFLLFLSLWSSSDALRTICAPADRFPIDPPCLELRFLPCGSVLEFTAVNGSSRGHVRVPLPGAESPQLPAAFDRCSRIEEQTHQQQQTPEQVQALRGTRNPVCVRGQFVQMEFGDGAFAQRGRVRLTHASLSGVSFPLSYPAERDLGERCLAATDCASCAALRDCEWCPASARCTSAACDADSLASCVRVPSASACPDSVELSSFVGDDWPTELYISAPGMMLGILVLAFFARRRTQVQRETALLGLRADAAAAARAREMMRGGGRGPAAAAAAGGGRAAARGTVAMEEDDDLLTGGPNSGAAAAGAGSVYRAPSLLDAHDKTH